MAKKKRKYTNDHLSNDPSLRYHDYQLWECLWSDSHNNYRRFVRYEPDGSVVLATMDEIHELKGSVSPVTVRRFNKFDKERHPSNDDT